MNVTGLEATDQPKLNSNVALNVANTIPYI